MRKHRGKMEKIIWGWTSYKKTGWVTEYGLKEYRAKFRGIYPATINRQKEQTIIFYTKHPLQMLRTIAEATEKGIEPLAFHGAFFYNTGRETKKIKP